MKETTKNQRPTDRRRTEKDMLTVFAANYVYRELDRVFESFEKSTEKQLLQGLTKNER
jgi:hypothetical protein